MSLPDLETSYGIVGREEIILLLALLAWEISCAEEPGELQSIGSQRVGHD